MGASIESRVGFGLRFAAILVDIVLMIVGGVVIGAVFGGVLGGIFGNFLGPIEGAGGEQLSGAQAGGALGIIFGAIIGVLVFGPLYALLEGFTGATIGKMLIGIKIGDADGTKAGIGKLLLRYIIKNIAFVSSVVAAIIGIELIQKIGGILGIVWFFGCFLALTSARQGLHDIIIKTAVYPKKVLS
jgi:uncharacterized RDD family membrane protein YckC